jgi:hypothetical protein
MQQASSTEIQSAIQKAVQAFKEMKYPVEGLPEKE